MKNTAFKVFWKSYVECSLWSSSLIDDNGNDLGNFLDVGLCEENFDAKSWWMLAKEAYVAFLTMQLICSKAQTVLAPDQMGHDFWLTRNRHGAGFWDRGLGDLGKELTDYCHHLGEVNLYTYEKDGTKYIGAQ